TDVQVEHNTALQTGNMISADGPVDRGFVFRNNLLEHGPYGVHGRNRDVGLSSLAAYFPGYVFEGNVIVGGDASLYPGNNYFPASLGAVGFVDLTAGNYRLAPGSPYHGQATDGTDVGCNFTPVHAAVRAGRQRATPKKVKIGPQGK